MASTATDFRLDGINTDYSPTPSSILEPLLGPNAGTTSNDQAVEKKTTEVARASIQEFTEAVKKFFKENVKNCFKFVTQLCDWIFIGSASTNLQAKKVAGVAKYGKGFIDLYSVPEKFLKLDEELVKQYDKISKQVSVSAWAAAEATGAAVWHVFAKIGEFGSAVIDGVITLFASLDVIKLSASVSLIVTKVSMFFLTYASIYNIHKETSDIIKLREEIANTRKETAEITRSVNEKKITNSVIKIAMWVSYLALATLVLVGVFSTVIIPNWVTLIFSSSALTCSFLSYFYKEKHGLEQK